MTQGNIGLQLDGEFIHLLNLYTIYLMVKRFWAAAQIIISCPTVICE